MIKFTAVLKKFDKMGEKTGWTYIEIPEELAVKLKPGNKKSFRVKGKLDTTPVEKVALIPMGGGDFIMAINATMRKGIGKRKGAEVKVQLAVDDDAQIVPPDFLSCLDDEPKALQFFKTFPKGHQNYFGKWIDSAKTEPTRAKRIAQAVNALANGLHFGLMIRALKNEKNNWQ